jgi:hypothetical protein
MDIFFGDDSLQRAPTRQGMNGLVAVGGIYVPSEHVNALERALNQLCVTTQFPPGEEFKWSPRREDWMHQGLTGPARTAFFLECIRLCSENRVNVTVVISDIESNYPQTHASHEDFTTRVLIERIEWLASRAGREVVIVFDRPGGAQAEEENFLVRCLETIQDGTPFLRPARIALNALSTSSHFVRMLQMADLITGCVTAYVAGESRYSIQLIPSIQPLLAENRRVGGIGIKIHPDFLYANLYHWLFGDSHFWRGNVGYPLPLRSRPYPRNANEFR